MSQNFLAGIHQLALKKIKIYFIPGGVERSRTSRTLTMSQLDDVFCGHNYGSIYMHLKAVPASRVQLFNIASCVFFLPTGYVTQRLVAPD